MVSESIKQNRDKILKCLAKARAEGNEFLWIREIARRTGINLGTVIWILDRYLYPDHIEYPATDDLLSKGLRIRPIRLKDSVFNKMVK